jgi:group I intron endonuclease
MPDDHRIGSIYEIIHRTSGRRYIGQTFNKPDVRWRRHLSSSRKSDDAHKQYVHRAIAKHGPSEFEFNIIWAGECSKIELNSFERFQIAFWNSRRNGFNETDGGEGCVGFKMPAEAIAKVIAANKGRVISEEIRARISASKKGRSNGHEGMKRSFETRLKQSKAKLGKKHTVQARANMSRARLGNQNAKGNTGNVGRRHSAEVRANMAAGQRRRREKEKLNV